MAADAIEIRPAEDGDRRALALLLAAVAEERDGIAAEPPVDVDKHAANWPLDGTIVALPAGVLVGELRVEPTRFGFGEIGMMVAAQWRVAASERRWWPRRSSGREHAGCTS